MALTAHDDDRAINGRWRRASLTCAQVIVDWTDWGQQQKRCVMTVHQMVEKDQQFVSVTGVIHLHTSIGVFLDVGKRRVFVSQFSYLDFASPLCGR